jgi:hypothetical protein
MSLVKNIGKGLIFGFLVMMIMGFTVNDYNDGEPSIWYKGRAVVYLDQASLPTTITTTTATLAIKEAVAEWNITNVGFKLIYGGTSSDQTKNLISFKSVWTRQQNALAACGCSTYCLYYIRCSIEINEQDYNLRTSEYDLKTIIAHELGHLIGLGHSEEPFAMMNVYTDTNVIKQITCDDVDGLVSLYGSIGQITCYEPTIEDFEEQYYGSDAGFENIISIEEGTYATCSSINSTKYSFLNFINLFVIFFIFFKVLSFKKPIKNKD